MRNYNRITPEGTKDLLLEECLVRRETEEKIRSVFQSQGYDELVTPGLEFFDVFQSEAVQYPQEQLYKLSKTFTNNIFQQEVILYLQTHLERMH